MPIEFAPTKILTKLFDVEPQTARVLFAGLSVIAVAAIAASSKFNVATMGLIGLYVLALGLVAILISVVVSDPLFKRILGGFVVTLIIVVTSAFLFSALFRNQSYLNPTYCLVRFWEKCEDVEGRLTAQQSATIDAKVEIPPKIAAPTPAPGVDVSKYRVYIQFAGLITREAVASLNASLRGGGWQAQGGSGERLTAAAGLNEVRYGADTDRDAAQQLASAVSATNISSATVSIRFVPSIKPGVLELWISN